MSGACGPAAVESCPVCGSPMARAGGEGRVMVRVLDALPEGWRYIEGALTAPTGFRWACNGKSRFSPGYRHVLVRCP